MALSRVVSEIFNVENVVTLKSGSEVTGTQAAGAFGESFRTVLTGLTAVCTFVYSYQTGLTSLTGFRLFSQDCPETCQNGRCRESDHSDTQELEHASCMSDRVS